jgi:hypothetical protein
MVGLPKILGRSLYIDLQPLSGADEPLGSHHGSLSLVYICDGGDGPTWRWWSDSHKFMTTIVRL